MKYRWDVLWSEGPDERARRIEEQGLKLRRDGNLDRRFKDMRWLELYRRGDLPRFNVLNKQAAIA